VSLGGRENDTKKKPVRERKKRKGKKKKRKAREGGVLSPFDEK